MDAEYQTSNESETSLESDDDFFDEDQNYIHNTTTKKRSYVWKYFKENPENPKSFMCNICQSSVGGQTCNLGRHLQTVHNINAKRKIDNKRGRPSRSFIWKYCTRQNERQAFCHLCKKLLYFGGGNTSNITKHLRRKHACVIENNEGFSLEMESDRLQNNNESMSSYNDAEDILNNIEEESVPPRKRMRRGTSYVWNYCVKVSKHTILCKLCDKEMSFHGTANVITHLQRKHNVDGKNEKINEANGNMKIGNLTDNGKPESDIDNANIIMQDNMNEHKRGPRSGPTSIVWKYCKRLDKDTVSCSFCKKNLSYQGTSNLARHLQRMHGLMSSKNLTNIENTNFNLNSIWDHCTAIDLEKVKCNMCNALFRCQDTEAINLHIIGTHGVVVDKQKRADDICYEEVFDDLDEQSWIKDETTESNSIIEQDKRFEMLYDDLIVEELDCNDVAVNNIEVPKSLETYEQDHELDQNGTVPEDEVNKKDNNPLSSKSSSEALSSCDEDDDFEDSNKRMKDLKEERVRMQAEYFREKAGYYRMQKYLTALQATKVRVEMEQLKNNTQFIAEATTITNNTDFTVLEVLPTN